METPPLTILVLGTYRSGSGDDPERFAELARERGLAVFASLPEVPGCG
jgi:hypothetical protein